jgi:hypothetical protein
MVMVSRTGCRPNRVTSVLLLAIIFCVYAVSAVGAGPRWSSPRSVQHHPQPSSWLGNTKHTSVSSSRVRRLPSALQVDDAKKKSAVSSVARGGRQAAGNFEKTVESIVNIVVSVCQTILPPFFEFGRIVTAFYRCLPMDTIIAQAGLVYCFAGGYYPTLFAALSAAQQCGWENMVQALDDLAEQTMLAIDAASVSKQGQSSSYRDVITQKTMVVLATIDPVKVRLYRYYPSAYVCLVRYVFFCFSLCVLCLL